ncbi:hypothetical protein IEO70_18555 [Bacillus sp. AGMB 02131]|uniref:DUF2268 domain-containing protein n=1 Tax=Peribacillus faecalis TaxID=2772559 RepID=A0A927HD90_9BACI|nr:DUF2268 domain-containing putative Zn-dependent protease [Peribacillus faecalis]MBD3110331.1 hypothetical protein [Peribacillus faecalis]
MAVIRTDQWLTEHNYNSKEVCGELLPFFENPKEKELLFYLQQNGMYYSLSQGKRDCKSLIKEDVWTKVEKLYKEYKKEWRGPDVPVFIFPMKKQKLFKKSHFKSGLAFSDKLFLFLSPKVNQHHLEALFIHEYHHVCRLFKQKKRIEKYTLSDAIILEGLAEYTVQVVKGEEYLAPWTKQYSVEFLQSCWDSLFEKNLKVLKGDKKHDALIFGRGDYPEMIGYCLGFYLVEKYFEDRIFSVESSFSLPSGKVINNFFKK